MTDHDEPLHDDLIEFAQRVQCACGRIVWMSFQQSQCVICRQAESQRQTSPQGDGDDQDV